MDPVVSRYAQDILDSEEMQLEKQIPHHGKVSCFEHSLAVAETAAAIARKLKKPIDMASLVRGALLHDFYLYDWHVADPSHRLHGPFHAAKALRNAEKRFRLNEIEKDIIRKHMFPLNLPFPLYPESWIVTLADKICTWRDFKKNRAEKKALRAEKKAQKNARRKKEKDAREKPLVKNERP